MRYRKASSPMGTVPSNDTPAAKGTTTAMIAVAADNAAITDACANSPGPSGPRDTPEWGRVPGAVTSRFCQ